ncbi:unnamed protein product, partial [Rotaria sp. Silwood2]
ALSIPMGQHEIRPFDGDLTFLGKILAPLPIQNELSRLIALGHFFGLVYETIVIVACLSTKNIFKISYEDPITCLQIRNVSLNKGILYRKQIEQQLKVLVDVEHIKVTFENTKALVDFASQYSTLQIVNPSELSIDQIVTSVTSHTNIFPAVYFAVKPR